MPLQAGTRLGPYEIVAAIGSGGMGEVYRARDPRLGRDVAIKVSAEAFTDRFEREARAVAALNHPNICTLHDVGPNYLVMEYIEGAPLKGPMPLADAFRCAAQICDALDAAHRKNIVHRDLKPANILVTKSGVKVLDFGLARIGSPLLMNEATLTRALTAKGEILGTLHYMSPEQLQGREAEAPSDIFSFGLVLYELLTGKKAFDGPSPASVIAAILERPAPSIGDVGPPALDRVLHRCLEKDPDRRWQSARDLKSELEWLGNRQGAAAAGSVSPKRSVTTAVGWIAATLFAIAFATTVWSNRKPLPESAIMFELNLPDGEVIGRGFPVISPDGSAVATSGFSGAGQPVLAVRRLDTLAWQTLPGTEGAFTPAWSPDSRHLAFLAGTKVKRIDVTGGPPQPVADVPGGWVPYVAWNRDNTILFSRHDGLWKVSASGGNPTQVTALDNSIQENLHGVPQFLPDGRHFLFLGRSPGDNKSAVYVGSLDASGVQNRTLVFPAASSAVYAEAARGGSPYLLFERGGALMAQAFDVPRAKVTGDPFLVAPEVGFGGSALAVSASQTGTLAISTGQANLVTTQLAWIDRTGKALGDVGVAGTYGDFSLSPDGTRIMVARLGTTTRDLDLWLIDVASRGMTRFTFDPETDRGPVWSPDGTRVVYTRSQSRIYEKSISGTGERPLSGVVGMPMDWSHDGHSILVRSNDGDLWTLTDGKPVRVTQTPYDETQAQFSPDGKWIAFVSNESRRAEVYVQAFPTAGEKFPISVAGGTQPRWRADGAELFYMAPDGKLMAVSVKSKAGFEHSAPTALFETQGTGSSPNGFDYVAATDGQRFLLRTPAKGTKPSPVVVMTNWLTLARK